VLAAVCVGMLTVSLDTGALNAAYPSLADAFGVPVAVISWVGIAYMITTVSSLAIYGRWADMVGRKRVFLLGYGVFIAGSLLAALAQNFIWLLAARVVVGSGAAMLIANSVAIIGADFPANRRGTAIGAMETSVAAALALGPIVGGVLVDHLSWRAIFFVNWPSGLVGLALGAMILRDGERAPKRETFDFLGAALFVAGMASFLIALTAGSTLGWDAPIVTVGLALALVLLPLFLAVEQRVPQPMLPLTLFRSRVFAAANAAKMCGYFAMMATLFTLPFYLERALGFTPAQIGVGLTPIPIALSAASLIMGPLSDRIGSQIIAPAGLAVCAVGCVLLTQVTPATGYPAVFVGVLVLTFGMGSFISPNDSAIVSAAPSDKLGVAGGILAMMRNLGMILGLAAAGTVLSARVAAYQADGLDASGAFVGAYHDFYLITAAVVVVGVVASLVRGRTLPASGERPG